MTNPPVRMLVTEVLEDLGYTAIEAADGAVGLNVLQSDVRIDMLVTDVGLPCGMNGRQMADAGRDGASTSKSRLSPATPRTLHVRQTDPTDLDAVLLLVDL